MSSSFSRGYITNIGNLLDKSIPFIFARDPAAVSLSKPFEPVPGYKCIEGITYRTWNHNKQVQEDPSPSQDPENLKYRIRPEEYSIIADENYRSITQAIKLIGRYYILARPGLQGCKRNSFFTVVSQDPVNCIIAQITITIKQD
jgi:hypothetical protein